MNTDTNRLLKCQITIRTASTVYRPYTGLFRSTAEAILDALNKIGELAHIQVRVLQ